MKRFSILIILLSIIVIGCSKYKAESGDNSQGTGSNTAINQPDNTTGPLVLSQYFISQASDSVGNKEDQLVWKNGDVSLIAIKTKQDVDGPISQILSSITIEKADKSFVLKLDQKFSTIDSITLSPDQNNLVISFSSGGGSTVILTDLINEESINLNSKLVSSGKEGVESIQTYNWSPDSETLAFAYGGPSTSSIGFYKLNDKSFTFAPKDTEYISTAYLLWNTDGNVLDFVSEQSSDAFKLFRFDLQKQAVQEIRDISSDELSSLNNFGPHYIGK